MIESLNSFEVPILLSIRDFFECGFLDAVLSVITKLGNAGIFWIILTVLLLIFKKTRSIGIVCALSLIFDLLLCNIILKPLVARIRPYDFAGYTPVVPVPSDYSFPSGHTASSFACAFAVFLHNKKYGIPCLVLAALIAFSRLYFCLHYPTDVFFGLLIGILCAVIANVIFKKSCEKLHL